jgi:tRNA (adenine57-N1/adenine58-N1)-methyltransferase
MTLRAGEEVLLHDRAGRRYRLCLQPGEIYSLHSGSFPHDELIGKPEGAIVSTNRGGRLLAMRPLLAERITKRQRQAQPIYPKDLGAIVMKADIYPGARVVEAGTGTGALTLTVWRAVGPTGHVTSYEAREDFHQAAIKAVTDAVGEVPANLELKVGDIYQDIRERNVDRIVLDVPEPWQAVPHVSRALRPGGIVFAHCPNVSQVQRFFDALRDHGGFGLLEAIELLERAWTVRGRSLRPAHRMVAHTGFLTFARRLAGEATFESEADGFTG